jgi:restriction system protein
VEEPEHQWQYSQLFALVKKLELNVFKRLNNTLTNIETTKIENEIMNAEYELRLDLNNPMYNAIKEEIAAKVDKIINDFREQLPKKNLLEKERLKLDQKIDQLHKNLSPTEFEAYIAELFEMIGFENVCLTPPSGDDGVDIFAEQNGAKIAIQCKKHKGTISSPDIQKFVGSMHHAGATKGFFVTTSVFSLNAEKFASQHPIELVDRIKLSELIERALNEN